MGWFSRDPQEEWDGQIGLNRRSKDPAAHAIADRMECCPNNPRHGGGGCNSGKAGPWTFGVETTETARRQGWSERRRAWWQ